MAETALSRDQWNEIIDAFSSQIGTRTTLRSYDGGIDIDPKTGLEVHVTGQDADMEPVRRAPNAAAYLGREVSLRSPTFTTTEQNSASALMAHYQRVLSAGDIGAVRLYNAAAMLGERMRDEGRERFEQAQKTGERGDQGWTMVGNTQSEARIARAFVDAVSKDAHRNNDVVPNFLENASQIDPERMNAILNETRAQMPPQKGPRIVAILATKGQEKHAALIARSPNFQDALFVIPANKVLENAIIAEGGGARLLKTHADDKNATLNFQSEDGKNLPSLQIEQNLKGREFRDAMQNVLRTAVTHSTQVAVFQGPTKYDTDFIHDAAREAAMQGKLAVFMDNGRIVNVAEADVMLAREAGEAKRQQIIDSIERVEKNIHTQMGMVAISQILNNASDFAALYKVSETLQIGGVGELARMANIGGEEARIFQKNGMSRQGVAALADLRNVRDVLRTLDKQEQQNNKMNVKVVVAPDKVAQACNRPILYVRGNENLLTDKKTVAMLGDSPLDAAGSKAARSVAEAGGTVVFVEGKGAPMDAKNVPDNAVLFVQTGHAFLEKGVNLTWQEVAATYNNTATGKTRDIEQVVRVQSPIIKDGKAVMEKIFDKSGAPVMVQAVDRVDGKDSDGQPAVNYMPRFDSEGKPVMVQKEAVLYQEVERIEVIKEPILQNRRLTFDQHVANAGKRTYILEYQDQYKNYGDKKSKMVLSVKEGDKVSELASKEFENARSARLSGAEKTRNDAEWRASALDMMKKAEIFEHANLVQERDRLKALKEVREAVIAKGGAIVSMQGAYISGYRYNTEVRGMQAIVAGIAEPKPALRAAMALSDTVAITKDANGRDSVAAEVVSEAARTGRGKILALIPGAGVDKSEHKEYIGNAMIIHTAADRLGRKMQALNEINKIDLGRHYQARAVAQGVHVENFAQIALKPEIALGKEGRRARDADQEIF